MEPLERRILLAGDVRVRYEFSELGGAVVQSLDVGNDYRLSVHIQDIQSTPNGLLKAFLDVNYPTNLISINGPLTHGPSYNLGGTGGVSMPGVIDEAGALDTDTIPPASRGAEFLLFSVPFHTDAVGTLVLTADPAETPTSFFQLFNLTEVPFVDIDFEGDSIEINGMPDPVVSVTRMRHGSEGGTGNGVFTVSQSTATATNTVIHYTVGGTATPGDDYTPLSGTVTIPAGGMSAAINVVEVDDALVEATETVTVTLTSIQSGDPTIDSGHNQATLNIVDNDNAKVSITATDDGREAGQVAGVLTVTQTAASASDTVVAYTVTGTATSGSDFTPRSGTLTIPAGQTSATITVPVLNDIFVEGTETVIVRLGPITSSDSDISIDGTKQEATLFILDDDVAEVTVEFAADGREFGPANGTFTVSKSAETPSDVIVTYQLSGSATAGVDYVVPTGTVTILAGETSATIDIVPLHDLLVEPNETVILSLTSIVSDNHQAEIGASGDRATLRITDDDTAQIRIEKTNDGNEDGPTSGLFTVTQSAVSARETVIAYTVGGTATEGTDFDSLSGSVTIPAGLATATIAIDVNDDSAVEGVETVTVQLQTITSGDGQISIDRTADDATLQIADNETPRVRIARASHGNETGPVSGRFTVSQDISTSSDTVISYSVVGTANPGSDFTPLGGTVTIPAGQTTATISVRVVDDDLIEGAETVTVTLDAITAGDPQLDIDPSSDQDTLTIADDDQAELSILTTANGEEAGPANAVFTVRQSAASTTDTVIAYNVAGSATPGADYTSLSGTVTIPAGQMSAVIAAAVINDPLVEDVETVIVTLTAITSGSDQISIAAGPQNTASAHITSDDSAMVSIASTNNASESGPVNGLFTVTQTAASSRDTVLTYTVGGTATEGADFGTLQGNVTIPAGQTSATIEVAVNDDAAVEGVETVTITLTNMTSGATQVTIDGTADQATLQISDDETPAVRITRTADGAESGPMAGTFTVTQNIITSIDTMVSYLVTGTASSGSDFTPLSETVTIPAGQTTAAITVPVVDDGLIEGAETVTVTLDAITAGDPQLDIDPSSNEAVLTIADNDQAEVSISATADGTESGPVNVQFTVSQSAASTTDTMIAYTVAGSATPGADYTSLSGTVTIPAGQMSAVIVATVVNDALVEDVETVIVTLTTVTSGSDQISVAAGPHNTASAHITSDDSAVVGIASTNNASESGPVNGLFTVTQTAASSSDTVLTYTVGGTATEGADFGTLQGNVTIPAGQTSATIEVAVNDDAAVEGVETVTITLTNMTSGATQVTIDGTAGQATLQISDDETPAVRITRTADGAESGPMAGTFTVTQNIITSIDTVVSYLVTGTASSGSDFTPLSETVTIPAGQMTAAITLPVVDDGLIEGAETVRVTLDVITAGDSQLDIDPSSNEAVLTIADNDQAEVSISATADGTESGPVNVQFTVSQSAASTTDTMIAYTVAGSATPGADYTSLSGTVTIPAGQMSAVIVATVVNDALVEDVETVIVTLTTVTSGSDQISVAAGPQNIASADITSDDSAVVGIASTNNASESGPVNGLFTVTQTAASSSDTVLTYTVGGTATEGADFGTLQGNVTIPAGQTSATIEVAVNDDAAVEGVETVTITLTNMTSGATQVTIDGTADQATLQISDDETPAVRIARTADGAESGPMAGMFTVTQNIITSSDTVISYSVAGTATSGSDFTPLSETVTIPAGQTTATITVPVVDDGLIEGAETVTVTLDSITAGDAQLEIDVANDHATLDIVDDEGGLISVASTTNGAESGEVNGVFTISQDGVTLVDTVISYTLSGAAAAGEDFMNLSDTVTIPAGQRSATIDVRVIDDAVVEGAETVLLMLDSITSGSDMLVIDGNSDSAVLMIADDDAAAVSIAKMTDGSETGPANGTFAVSQSAASSTETVIVYMVNGTAAAGDDYVNLSGSVVIPAGEISVIIDVPVVDDNVVELSETVTVTLVSISGNNGPISIDSANANAALEIIDNDDAELTVTAQSGGSEAGTSAGAFVVSLSGPSSTATTVSYSIGGTATAGSDYEALTGLITIAAGTTSVPIDVTVLDDARFEATETVTVTLDSVSDGNPRITIPAAGREATVEIADDESGLISVATTADGREAGPVNAQFMVRQGGTSDTDTVVAYTIGGSATSGSDFVQLIGTVTIPAGETEATIDVAVINDLVIEGPEMVTIVLGAIDNGDQSLAIDPAAGDAALQILDNDTALVSVASATEASEGDASYTAWTVTQDGVVEVDTVVSYSVTGTAAAGSDFVMLTGTVTIAAGETTAEIDLTVLDDGVVEPTETVVVTLDAVSGAAPVSIDLDHNVATVEIRDNDAAEVSIAALADGNESGTSSGAFVVLQTAVSSSDTEVRYSVSGTATAGSDFTALSGIATLPAGQTSVTIDIPVIDDVAVEGSETVTVTLTMISGDPQISINLAEDGGSIQIVDNDLATIAFTAPTSSIFEVAGSHAVAVGLSISGGGTLARPVSVNVVDRGNGTATSPTDFSLMTTSITFPAGSRDGDVREVALTIVDDGVMEDDETIRLELEIGDDATSGQATIGANNAHTATIVDDPMTGSISGIAWVDANHNGQLDGNEARLPGVTIRLMGQGRGGQAIDLEAMTDVNGAYRFIDLPSGSFHLIESQPQAVYDGDESLGTVDGTTSGEMSNDRFNSVMLGPAGTGEGYNFGEWGLKPQFVSARLFLASTNTATMLRNIVADAEGLAGNATLSAQIRSASMPSIVSAGSAAARLAPAGTAVSNPMQSIAQLFAPDVLASPGAVAPQSATATLENTDIEKSVPSPAQSTAPTQALVAAQLPAAEPIPPADNKIFPAVDGMDNVAAAASSADTNSAVIETPAADFADPPNNIESPASAISPRPTVRIFSLDSQASESGDPGAIRITREGDLTTSLRIYFSFFGDAQFGTGGDYTLRVGADNEPIATNYLDIPAGASHVDVVVDPLEDDRFEPTEIAGLSLKSHDSYDLDLDEILHQAFAELFDDDLGLAAF